MSPLTVLLAAYLSILALVNADPNTHQGPPWYIRIWNHDGITFAFGRIEFDKKSFTGTVQIQKVWRNNKYTSIGENDNSKLHNITSYDVAFETKPFITDDVPSSNTFPLILTWTTIYVIPKDRKVNPTELNVVIPFNFGSEIILCDKMHGGSIYLKGYKNDVNFHDKITITSNADLKLLETFVKRGGESIRSYTFSDGRTIFSAKLQYLTDGKHPKPIEINGLAMTLESFVTDDFGLIYQCVYTI